jgi:vacuolar protein sorting-associated protein 35
MATSPIGEDQGRLLEEALGVVRQQSQQMRKCLETPGKLMDALKCGYEKDESSSPTIANPG